MKKVRKTVDVKLPILWGNDFADRWGEYQDDPEAEQNYGDIIAETKKTITFRCDATQLEFIKGDAVFYADVDKEVGWYPDVRESYGRSALRALPSIEQAFAKLI